ncbi:uncharacterized protein UV8b_07117 [Ustilaginoidea virens]|uniref:C3HC zinc finger domain-containing protein n=1 Tax=Ustilaginoidea virens TaxID=1159556 RepID=A0A8E5MKA0_USTVR|nr:uncharacterized protein UV8b_07117 [Ustilaginoidea virens]QUC22876.1 hypothetical protein UV8b_07117 [Ustilaginoidea virens]
MNATKRKFNALLQGLSTPRPTTPNTTDDMSASRRYGADVATNDALLQKRRRLGFPESTAPILYDALPAERSLSSVVLKRSATQSSSSSATDPPAKYCPGDRDQLLKRLATFQEITDWTPKPDKVNEIAWAKRGWICQGKEKVRCVLCHRELLVKLDKKGSDVAEAQVSSSSAIVEALVDRYSALIVSSHLEDCLWRKRGCDDTLLRLSFSKATATLAALRQRYDELCSRSPFLPYEANLRLPVEINLDNILAQLPSDFFTSPPPIIGKSGTGHAGGPPNRVALLLALMGWQGLTNQRIGAVPNSASCHTCLRRLGLWMFKSKQVGEQGEVIVPAPMDHLDPLREHRFFCPWRNAEAQSQGMVAAGKAPATVAWKALLQTIKNESDLRNVCSENSSRVGQLRKGGIASASPTREASNTPELPTPRTPTGKTSANHARIAVTPQDDSGHEEDEKLREAKDKERWARLRRVKSLFDTKASRKARRAPVAAGAVEPNRSTTGT